MLIQKGRTSWVRESDEPDVELYGGGRKGVKRYAHSFLSVWIVDCIINC